MTASAKLAEVMATFQYADRIEAAKAGRARAQRQLRQLLAVLGVLALIGVVAAPGFYFAQFHGPLSANSEDWNRFGGFIGGTLGPFFGALTIAGVLVGVLLQRKQLDLASELAESAQIHEATIVKLQEQTARAMAAQAEHAALNAKANTLASVRELMELDIARLREAAEFMGNIPTDEHGNNLLAQANRRRDRVAAELQNLVDQLIGVDADGTPQGMALPPQQGI